MFSQVLKLQQKVNELKANNEDLRDEKKSLGQKVRELEADLEGVKASGVQKEVQILRDKLNAAESLCEELMDVNEEMKKEIRDMEEEMDEMQDKFRLVEARNVKNSLLLNRYILNTQLFSIVNLNSLQ